MATLPNSSLTSAAAAGSSPPAPKGQITAPLLGRFTSNSLWVETGGLAAILAIGAAIAALFFDLRLGTAGLILASTITSFACMRWAMELPCWASILGALLFVSHPLALAASSLATPFIPVAFVLGCLAVRSNPGMVGVLVAILFGLAVGLLGTHWSVNLVLYLAILATEHFRPINLADRCPSRLPTVLSVAVVASIVVSATGWRIAFSTEVQTHVAETTLLGWIDPAGFVAKQTGLQALASTTGTAYLGWSFVLLCSIAMWPGRNSNRRFASLVVAAMTLGWLTLEIDLHSQLVHLFQHVTVQRQVDAATLHLVGLLVLPVTGLAFCMFFGVGQIARTGQSWGFWTTLIASAATMAWWQLIPPQLLSPLAEGATNHAGVVAFLLACGAAIGVQRTATRVKTGSNRIALVAILFSVCGIELFTTRFLIAP